MSASDQNQNNAKWDIGSDYPAPNNAAIGSPSLEQQTAASNQSQCGNPHNQQRVPTAVDRVREVVDLALGEDDTEHTKFMADVDSLVKNIKDDGIV